MVYNLIANGESLDHDTISKVTIYAIETLCYLIGCLSIDHL